MRASAPEASEGFVSQASSEETDIRLCRSRLLVAMAAAHLKSLRDILSSVPDHLAPRLEAEMSAGGKVVELLSTIDSQNATLLQKRQEVVRLQQRVEEEVAARRRERDDVQVASAKNRKHEAGLQQRLEMALGTTPATPKQELSMMAYETRINQLQGVVVSLQTELRQAGLRAKRAEEELMTVKDAAAPQLRALAHLEEEMVCR